MKNRVGLYILVISIIIMIFTIVSACSNNINGSKILSKDGVKGHDIVLMNITFFDSDNRVKSPIAILNKDDTTEESYMQEFRDIIMKSKGISHEGQDRFSPASDSSHFIEVAFDNDSKLDFYYSSEHDWIIWSNVKTEDEQKILEYHFLSPAIPMAEWLSKIEPLTSLE